MVKPKAINRNKLVAFVWPIGGRMHTPTTAGRLDTAGGQERWLTQVHFICVDAIAFSFGSDAGTPAEEENENRGSRPELPGKRRRPASPGGSTEGRSSFVSGTG